MAVRTCPDCGLCAEEEEAFPPNGYRADGTRRYKPRCRTCAREEARKWAEGNRERLRLKARRRYAVTMATEEGRERLRTQARERKRRDRKTSEGRARAARATARYREKMKATDPTWQARLNARDRARRAQLKAEDPAAYERLRERERKNYQRWLSRPGNRARAAESRRLWAALRRDQRGVLGTGVQRSPELKVADPQPMLPARPLGDYLERLVRRAEGEGALDARTLVCTHAGVEVRTLYAWVSGEREQVHFNLGDQVLTRTGANPWDVWDPEDHAAAVAAFAG